LPGLLDDDPPDQPGLLSGPEDSNQSRSPSDLAREFDLWRATKAFGVGLGRGLTGLVGAPGDYANAYAPESWRDPKSQRLPTSKEVEDYLARYFGPFYEPQGIWEERAHRRGAGLAFRPDRGLPRTQRDLMDYYWAGGQRGGGW
jgi:hypothetical protein